MLRLRHIGWEKSGHGLSSRPRDSASELFLNELLGLFRYPPGSGRAFLAGSLPLRYCAARFACKTPTWSLQGLVKLLAWLPLIVRLLVVVGVRFLIQGFTGLVVLVQEGKD